VPVRRLGQDHGNATELVDGDHLFNAQQHLPGPDGANLEAFRRPVDNRLVLARHVPRAPAIGQVVDARAERLGELGQAPRPKRIALLDRVHRLLRHTNQLSQGSLSQSPSLPQASDALAERFPAFRQTHSSVWPFPALDIAFSVSLLLFWFEKKHSRAAAPV